MNRLQQRRRRAAARGCFAYRRCDGAGWDVFVNAEGLLGPRGLVLSRRQAVGLAYAISLSAKPKVVITFGGA